MSVEIKSKLNSSFKFLFVVSLMFVLLSLIVCVFVPNVEGQSIISVGTESELRDAVNNAAANVPVVIALNRDIEIKGTLYVVDKRNITLTSNTNVETFRLFATGDSFTIALMNGGSMKLDGIIISHGKDDRGSGVYVDRGCTLHLTAGRLSGNSDGVTLGGGNFIMSGGEISDNSGCGVSINDDRSSFVMTGGKISGNQNGGVYNTGVFSMSDGEISNNKCPNGDGGGVRNSGGSFTMSGGTISGNSAIQGGGVATFATTFTDLGIFTLTGGKIFGNTASWGGGVCIGGSVFVMSGGEISGNEAGRGGGVCNSGGSFTMSKGVISNNKATYADGGGVYSSGTVELSGGTISNNNAVASGGGVWVAVENLDKLFVREGVVFSNNRASEAYDRNPIHDEVYRLHVDHRVTWTSPFTQGYNNYDISYINDTPTSPAPSDPAYSPNPSILPSGSVPSDNDGVSSFGVIIFIIALVLIVGVVVGGLFFYFKKK